MANIDAPTFYGAHSGDRYSFDAVPQLTKALRKGDEEAFRWLHAQWNNRLLRYCFTIARANDALANELAQSTYLRILRHIRPLPDEEALWRWIARAARSAAIDQYRTGSRYRTALSNLADWMRGYKKQSEPNGLPLLEHLNHVISTLSSEEQTLIELRYFKQVPLTEIGIEFDCSARAVEGRLARLRKKIQQHMHIRMQAEVLNEYRE